MVDIVRKTSSINDPLHVGFIRTYSIDGKEVYRETLDKNLDIQKHEGTMPDGTVKEFFENGKLYFECEFKNGQRNGKCKIYYENGKVNIEKYYENGLLQGKARVYNPTGKLYKEFSYVNDIQDGKQIKYYPSGKILEVSEYQKGYLNGISITKTIKLLGIKLSTTPTAPLRSFPPTKTANRTA